MEPTDAGCYGVFNAAIPQRRSFSVVNAGGVIEFWQIRVPRQILFACL
jgi:hypothetical protein